MTSPAATWAAITGASVGELLQAAEEQLYRLAVQTPSGNQLLAAWPQFAHDCARLTAGAVGLRHPHHLAAPTEPDADPVVVAGIRLCRNIRHTRIDRARVVPDPTLARAGQLIAAAADLLDAVRDPSGLTRADTPQAGAARAGGVRRGAELVLAGADLTLRAAGRARVNHTLASPRTRAWVSLSSRAVPLFETRRHAAAVIDAAAGRPRHNPLDDLRVAAVDLADPGDPLGRLQVAIADWRRVSLEAVDRAAPSSAEIRHTTLEARHLIALAAALTDAAAATGLARPGHADTTVGMLQRAGRSWSNATDAWTTYTTGVPATADHITATRTLHQAIRDLTRDAAGNWLPATDQTNQVDLPAAVTVAKAGLAAVVDVAKAHDRLITRLALIGGLYARADALPVTEERIEARIRGKYLPLGLADITGLRHLHATATRDTLAARATAHDPRPPSTGATNSIAGRRQKPNLTPTSPQHAP